MTIYYTLIVSIGRHNACVQVLAKLTAHDAWNSSSRLRHPFNAVWRSEVYMEKEVETWDSTLFTRAIRTAIVHGDRDIHFLFSVHTVTSGMFLLWLSLMMHMDDIQ